jgi:8-oxo-dGTP diphosphatase
MPNTGPDSPVSGARVHVAVGVVSDGAGRVLVARRPDHVHQGGLWEFPGGKVESGETVEQALRRELLEELAIEVRACESLLTIQHDYTDKAVCLDVWWVSAFGGEPQGREGQPWRWVAVQELHTLSFPQANRPILAAIEQRFAAVG